MADKIVGFEEKDPSEDEWSNEGKSLASMEGVRDYTEESQVLLNRQSIVFLPQEKVHTDRKIIPATWMEKLSYYRAYASSSSKTEILCLQQNNVNRFVWFYVSNALCKSLSMTYVYIFLSSYSPDHHFFVPKMVPIFYGLKWINILCARFLLQIISNDAAMHIYYTIFGVIAKAPWNRCKNRIIYLMQYEIPISKSYYICMDLEEFAKQFVNNTIIFNIALYWNPTTGDFFTAAQIGYYDEAYEDWYYYLINIVIWITAAILYNQLFKSYLWKILHYAHLSLIVLFILIFFHLIIFYEDKAIQHIIAGKTESNQETLMFADFDMLAESMAAPPIAHVLSARTTTEIKPSLNSAVIVISNGAFYILKAMTTYMMKQYCEKWVNGSIMHWNYGSASNFYSWPIYFATVRFGSIIAVVFFALNAVVEYCMFIITFQCLIEVVKCEWGWVKPWCLSVVIVFFAIIEICFLPTKVSQNSFIFYMSLSSLAEILIIFWIYPLDRFVDDITFHFGVTPTRLRRWTFCFLPWYYLYKILLMLNLFYSLVKHDFVFKYVNATRHAPTCIIVLLILGAAYAFLKYVIIQGKGFSQLFKPVPEWGPKDFRLRQLRKQFQGRDYIASEASRDLSRYLIEKSGRTSYKLDLPYDAQRKSALRVNAKDVKEKER